VFDGDVSVDRVHDGIRFHPGTGVASSEDGHGCYERQISLLIQHVQRELAVCFEAKLPEREEV
jgi:hypothetical protein